MTFKEIQDAVLSDRFDESKRASAKLWINSRYGRLWAAESWSFKQGIFTFPVVAGTSSVTLTGIQRVNAVYDSDTASTYNSVLYGNRPEDHLTRTSTTSRKPYAFTVINGVLRLENPILMDTTLTVLGETKFVPLVEDEDVPLLPEEFHYGLVHGGKSEGLRDENDPSWQGVEQDWQATVADMKSGYLTAVRTYGDAQPAWP